MLDVAPTELLLVAVVAVLVIGPKDLPKAMRVVGYWVGKMRGVARQFRSGFDDMVREAEFAEMEKKWAEENARIMREFPNADTPPTPALPAPEAETRSETAAAAEPAVADPAVGAEPLSVEPEPVMTAEPTLFDDPVVTPPAPAPAPPPPAPPSATPPVKVRRKPAPKAPS